MQAQRVDRLNPYKPGEQPKDREYCKLNANENPYPPPPDIAAAVTARLQKQPVLPALYPDPDSGELRSEIAGLLNRTGGVLARSRTDGQGCVSPNERDALPFTVTPDMIFTGNGSDEVLSFVFYAFFDGDRPVVQPEHTYSFYPVYAGFYNIPVKKVPLTGNFCLDTDALLSTAAKTDSSIIFANPNAPTGIGMSRNDIRALLSRAPAGRIHVIDEAYVDFGGESCLSLLAEFDNLVIVRTFSKSMSFAGMRLGYAVASPGLIQILSRVKDSFNHFPVDTLTQIAGCAACRNTPYYVDAVQKIVTVREQFSAFLQTRGWNVLPSVTNFIFTAKAGVSGAAAYEYIKKQGVLVRRFDSPGISDFLRITIGTAEQMIFLQNIFEHSGNVL